MILKLLQNLYFWKKYGVCTYHWAKTPFKTGQNAHDSFLSHSQIKLNFFRKYWFMCPKWIIQLEQILYLIFMNTSPRGGRFYPAPVYTFHYVTRVLQFLMPEVRYFAPWYFKFYTLSYIYKRPSIHGFKSDRSVRVLPRTDKICYVYEYISRTLWHVCFNNALLLKPYGYWYKGHGRLTQPYPICNACLCPIFALK